jgi:hypothetical protein
MKNEYDMRQKERALSAQVHGRGLITLPQPDPAVEREW